MPDRILVVDDEESILFALMEYFTKCGYEVDCAKEVEEARTLLNGPRYSVAIVDLRLTGVDGVEGLEFIEYLRELSPETRTILLTAYGSVEIEQEARRRGVDIFLHKPKPLHEMAQVVSDLLARK
ncbi:MAG: response regulator [Blastocatellia bacterium]|nr:response regulator [Blastocatellia bacterium]